MATARDPQRLEDLIEKYGDQVRAAPLDVADEAAAYTAVQVAVDTFGRLDVVVNNAGYGDVAPFEQLSSERFKAVVDTNFYGVVNAVQPMQTAGARLVSRQTSRLRGPCLICDAPVGGRFSARPIVWSSYR